MSLPNLPGYFDTEAQDRRLSFRVSRFALQGLLILLVLGLSLVPIALTQRNLSSQVLTLLLAGLAALILLRLPALGVIGLILANLAVRNVLTVGGARMPYAVPIVVALFGLWAVRFILRRQDDLILPGPMTPALAMAVVSMIAFVVGLAPWLPFAQPAPISAQLAGMGIFIVSALTFFLAAHQLQELKWLKMATWLVILCGSGYIAIVLIPGLGGLVRRLIPGGATGSLLWTWMTAMAFSQGLFNNRLSKGWRLLLLLAVVGTFAVNLFNIRRWASGWVPPMAGIAVVLWARSPKLGFVATLAGFVAIGLNPNLIQDTLIRQNTYSINTRIDAWIGLLDIVWVNPVLGLGPANYYYYTSYFPVFGSAINFNSHNNYLDIIVQTGFVGLAVFLWFAASATRQGWRLRERVPEGFPRAYVYGALGGLGGTMVAGMMGDWVVPFVYNVGLSGLRASLLGWLFLGGLTALEVMYKDSESAPKGIGEADSEIQMTGTHMGGAVPDVQARG